MYIKQVVLDGFKSYSRRTVVGEFDSKFTAITGLNGSGKSNILDAICFALGITQLSHLRVANLTELIYKNGQSGITTASVSIVFDNTNPEHKPPGYEEEDEITVTRQVATGGNAGVRGKYMINGRRATQKQVHDMFRSVQLNINNPHFLIMQGRIVKVLNAKPREILGLIEECVGTRTYDKKRAEAYATIKRKQQKLRQIDTQMNDVINPQMEKLQEQRRKRQKLRGLITSHRETVRALSELQGVMLHRRQKEQAALKQEAQKRMADISSGVDSLSMKVEEAKTDVQKLKQQHAEAQSNNGQSKLQQDLDTAHSAAVQANEQCKSLRTNVAKEQAALKSLQNARDKLQEEVEKMAASLQGESDQEQKTQETVKKLEQEIRNLEDQQFGVSVGESDGSLAGQLMAAKKHVSELELKHGRLSGEKKQLKGTIAQKRRLMERVRSEFEQKQHDAKQLEAEVASLEKRLQQQLGDDIDSRKQQLEQQRFHLEQERYKLEASLQELRGACSRGLFKLNPPVPGVYGTVAQLFRVRPGNEKWSLAIQTAAGGLLYNVVVESQQVGRQVLQHPALRQRVNVIPLDKIRSNPIEDRVKRMAQGATRDPETREDRLFVASDLVETTDESQSDRMSPVLDYVFGKKFVALNERAARHCVDTDEIKRAAVTIKGDEYAPGGTLSGGSAPNSDRLILLQMQQLRQLESQYAQLEQQRRQCVDELNKIENAERGAQSLVSRRNKLRDRLQRLRNDLQNSDFTADQETVNTASARIEEINAEFVELLPKLEAARESAAKLQEALDDLQSTAERRERRLRMIAESVRQKKRELEAAVQSAESLSEQLRERQVALHAAREELQQDVPAQLAEKEKEIAELEAKFVEQETLAKQSAERKKALEKRLVQLRSAENEFKRELEEAQEKVRELEKLRSEVQRKKTKQRHELDELQKRLEETSKQLRVLTLKHAWVTPLLNDDDDNDNRSKYFDWGMERCEQETKVQRQTAAQQQANIEALEKQVGGGDSAASDASMNNLETEVNRLRDRRRVVEADKQEMQKVMKELDKRKKEALERTWGKVSVSLGRIFGSLLPGTTARLRQEDPDDLMEGLVVEVDFGATRKTLTELSGGQRSLLALSLVLAMLQFRPAPLYILDEVDAALDLSHTQNIGSMLRRHFSQAQFVVVSLKEGMFENASVLFRTKFVDGASAVKRSVRVSVRRDQ
ncbi:MAG: hypothetical protein MHM6MM_002973 [Cercozoa sp. M6MM]